MRSNYKPLGKYIQPVIGRNNDLGELPLVGLSIQKKFIPSIANIIGTDMSTYRIIERNQFAYGPVTSRNGDKITIALFDVFDKALISQAYTPFSIKDSNELDPEYLMMWFRRPEFDRYARFKSHGSAREIFDWEEMRNVMLPVPHIDKQKEIVKEYNAIQNCIALNQQLIQKLEETAQAVYREWFLEGIDNENLPEGWSVGRLADLYKFQYGIGNTNPHNGGQFPVFGAGGIIGMVDKYNNEDAPVIGHMGEYCGKVTFAFGKHFVTYNGVMCIAKNEKLKWFSYLTLLSKDLMSNTRGSSQPFISYDMLYEIQTVIPNNEIVSEFEMIAILLFKQVKIYQQEIQKLIELRDIILCRLTTVQN